MRTIRFYDTREREVRPFEPREDGKVGIYACGPTVYSRGHVGNARPFVVFSLLKRYLEHEGYEVTFVANITDINDKIYDAARAAGRDSADLARDMTAHYLADTEQLGLGRPDPEPLASEYVGQLVDLIAALVDSGHAYAAGGDVYFRVRTLPEYGALSRRDVDQMDQGEGVEGADLKDDPLDFALWKAHKEGEDTWWDSPWGRGRPGWHIECSAMAEAHLGPVFEIHGGGIDLVFPHHENEIAQSRALGHEFAQLWMHNGMLRLAGEKMSKSLGNIVSLREALDTWGRETLLVYFLGGHWRKPIDYSDEVLQQAAAQAESFRNVFRGPSDPGGAWGAFSAALDDDFNTPDALAVMHGWRDHDLLRRGLEVFGVESLAEAESAPAELEELARARLEARTQKDFATSDRLRDEIAEAGWEVRDVDAEPGYQLVPIR